MAFPAWALLKNKVLGNIVGFGAGAAASNAFEPALRPIQYELEQEFTNRVLSPDDLAELQQRGEISMTEGAHEAASTGLDAHRFELLTKVHGQSLGPEELVVALRRGYITPERFARGIAQGTVRVEWEDVLRQLAQEELSAEVLAAMVVQGVVQHDAARALAHRVGVRPEDFDRMTLLAGNPIAPEQALSLWNRGEISEGDVDRALVQSRLKPEWVDNFKKLRKIIPSVSDMIRFAVREAYTPDIVREFKLDDDLPAQFTHEAQKHGLMPEDSRLYWRAHWDLPSPEQGFAMFHRDIIKKPALELLLKTLDVMPYWRTKMVDLAYHVPGRIDLRRMFRFGVLDRAQLIRGYLDIGYSPEDAAKLADFAEREKMNAERDFTKTEILALYKGEEMALEEAKTGLGALGYDEHEQGLMLALADQQRAKEFRTAVVGIVHRRFVEGEIDETTARARMSTQGLAPAAQDRNIELWTFERATNPKHLTEAQIRAAMKRKIVTPAQYANYLQILGYGDFERQTLLALYAPK